MWVPVLKKIFIAQSDGEENVDNSSLYQFICLEQHDIMVKKKVFRIRRSGFVDSCISLNKLTPLASFSVRGGLI